MDFSRLTVVDVQYQLSEDHSLLLYQYWVNLEGLRQFFCQDSSCYLWKANVRIQWAAYQPAINLEMGTMQQLDENLGNPSGSTVMTGSAFINNWELEMIEKKLNDKRCEEARDKVKHIENHFVRKCALMHLLKKVDNPVDIEVLNKIIEEISDHVERVSQGDPRKSLVLEKFAWHILMAIDCKSINIVNLETGNSIGRCIYAAFAGYRDRVFGTRHSRVERLKAERKTENASQ